MNTQLRELQNIELDMLKTILEIFEKRHINYYALGGTLLGCVRHKGFIPWDDDIDLGVPRPDYERFLAIAEKELPEHLRIVYYRTQKGEKRPIYMCQVQNTNVKIRQNIANKPIETYAWVDIFPLDGMPDNSVLRKIHSFYLLYRRLRIQFSMFDENVHQFRTNRPWYEKALIKFYRMTKIGSNSNPFEMMEKMDKALTKNDYEKCGWIINFMGAWKLKEMFPKSVYGNGKMYPFEDIYLNAPENSDFVLKQMYGDYMTPVQNMDEIENHHKMEIVQINEREK